MRPVLAEANAGNEVIPNPRKVWTIAERCRSAGKAEGRGWSGLLSRPDNAAGRPAAPALHRRGGRRARRFPRSKPPIVQGFLGFGIIPTLHTQPKRAERVLEKITRSRANCGRIPSLNQFNPAACRTQPDSPGVLIPRHPLLLTAPVPGAVSKSVRCESRPPLTSSDAPSTAPRWCRTSTVRAVNRALSSPVRR